MGTDIPQEASRGYRLREKLFNRFSANLTIWFPDTNGVFVCPVCRSGFSTLSLETNPPSVALAHIVPRSLGGGPKTLICRPCENDLSAALDRAAADEARFHEWLAGRQTRYASVSEPEGHVSFEFGTEGERPTLKTIPERSSPQAREALIKRLMSKAGASFTVRIQTFHERRRDLSYLYHAFLAMFDVFGYEFAFAREVDRVRALLVGDEEANLRSILRSVRVAPEDMPETPPHINVATSREHPSCFFVALPPLLPAESARGVILPGPDPASARYFDFLVDNPAPFSGDMRLTWVPRQRLMRLDDPDSRGQMLYIFTAFSRDGSRGDGDPVT